MYFFILKAIYISAMTEYTDFVYWFYIFCTKGDSLQISAILYRYRLFYDYISIGL
jgi:hypothetical protein